MGGRWTYHYYEAGVETTFAGPVTAQQIHLYTYMAVALAFSHQFAAGADFRFDAKARWLWSVMYVAVGGLLLWYRVYTPIRAAMRHQLRVVQVRRETSDVVSAYVTGHRLDLLRAEPGQFFRWRFLTAGLWWVANSYSLSPAPSRPDLPRLTAKISGGHSAALLRLRPGTRVIAEGPCGAFTAGRRQVPLLAGDVAITPLRALVETLPEPIRRPRRTRAAVAHRHRPPPPRR